MQLLEQPDSRGWREVNVKPLKFEYRISKSETNSKSECLNVQNKDHRKTLKFLRFDHLDFGNSDLFRASCFVFRILIAPVIAQRLFSFPSTPLSRSRTRGGTAYC
jgi:hypothetical protein